jgi:hypothetical protein
MKKTKKTKNKHKPMQHTTKDKRSNIALKLHTDSIDQTVESDVHHVASRMETMHMHFNPVKQVVKNKESREDKDKK